VVVALAAGFFVFVVSRTGGRGGNQAWALQFTEGEVTRYRVVESIDGTVTAPGSGDKVPLHVVVGQTIAARVVSVDPEGTATMDVTIEKSSFTVNGQTQAAPTGAPTRLRIAKDGTYVSVGGLDLRSIQSTGVDLPGLDRLAPFLPDHPVEPGDSWTRDIDVPFPFADGPLGYRSTNVFLREENVDGRRAAVISSDWTLVMDLAVDVRQALQAQGELGDDIPPAAHPQIRFEGGAKATELSWYDPEANEALKSTVEATLDVTVEFDGFPEAEALLGSVTFAGSIDLFVENIS
jgi:hypothetical protein